MKVLITGCTSQQASPKHAGRTPTFSNLLAQSFRNADIEASVASPRLDWDESFLKEFDLVIVGISPTTSVSANMVYPAFVTANKARKIGNLALLIDAAESFKIPPSLTAWSDETVTFKSFYERRKSYFEVSQSSELKAQLFEFVEYLSNEAWPTTFYPSYPWSNPELLTKYLPNLSAEKLVAVSVDSYLIFQSEKTKNYLTTDNYWTCDYATTATKNLAQMLTMDVVPTKESPWELQDETLIRIRHSVGTIVATHRNNESWWSPAFAQSLSQKVPVSCDWKITGYMGSEWEHLATSIESMDYEERSELAFAQKTSYLKNLPTRDDINETLTNTLKQLV